MEKWDLSKINAGTKRDGGYIAKAGKGREGKGRDMLRVMCVIRWTLFIRHLLLVINILLHDA